MSMFSATFWQFDTDNDENIYTKENTTNLDLTSLNVLLKA